LVHRPDLAVVEEPIGEPGGVRPADEPIQRGLVVVSEAGSHRLEHPQRRLVRPADEQSGTVPVSILLAGDVVFAEFEEESFSDRSEELHIDVAVEEGAAHAFPAGPEKDVHLPEAGLGPSRFVEGAGRAGLVVVLERVELEFFGQRREKVVGVHRSMRWRERRVEIQVLLLES
jgi:hypothetical protein